MDGMAAAGGLRAGWHTCSTGTTGQISNPSTPKQQDKIFTYVFHSVTENGPKLPMTLSDKMRQLQDFLISPSAPCPYLETMERCSSCGPQVGRICAISHKSSNMVPLCAKVFFYFKTTPNYFNV